MNLVVVVDEKTKKSESFACEETDIDECAEWLANRLAYSLVMREGIDDDAALAEGLSFREVMNRINKRKGDFRISVFDAPEDDPAFDKEKYSDGKFHPEEEISLE